MRIVLPILALSLIAVAYAAAPKTEPVQAEQTEWVDWGENPMANPEFMTRMMELSSPAEAHEGLAHSVGSFDITGKMWMDPAGEPMPMKATSEIEMILGGRYMMEHFKSDFMGMPYEGLLILGYDKLQEQYVSFWYDTMSTWPMTSRGTADEEGNMKLKGTVRDLLTPGGRQMRSTHHHNDDGTFTMHMYDSLPDGGEFQVMELNYTRNEAATAKQIKAAAPK